MLPLPSRPSLWQLGCIANKPYPWQKCEIKHRFQGGLPFDPSGSSDSSTKTLPRANAAWWLHLQTNSHSICKNCHSSALLKLPTVILSVGTAHFWGQIDSRTKFWVATLALEGSRSFGICIPLMLVTKSSPWWIYLQLILKGQLMISRHCYTGLIFQI